MLPSFVSVDSHVRLEVPVAVKAPLANDARIIPLARMPFYVRTEVCTGSEFSWTEVTLQGLFTSVYSRVLCKGSFVR